MSNNFVSKKKINKILQIYGGNRKYALNEKYSLNKKCEIVFTRKNNEKLWLVMRKCDDGNVEVTQTNDVGKIIYRDVYSWNNEDFDRIKMEVCS